MNTVKRRGAFISYSRKDRDFALQFAREMKSAGYFVWLDQLDIPTGARWDDEVEKALRECEIFLIILTNASVSSDNVKDEIGYAIDHGKHIMPVLLENCEVPLRLRRFQYVDFTKMEFYAGIERAKQLLESLIAEPSAPGVIVPSELKQQIAPNRGAIPASRLPNNNKPVQRQWLSLGAGICSLAVCLGVAGAIFIYRYFIFGLAPILEPVATMTIIQTATELHTDTQSPVPPTVVPPTQVPPIAISSTQVPPTAIPPTQVPPTAIPPTIYIPPTFTPQLNTSAYMEAEDGTVGKGAFSKAHWTASKNLYVIFPVGGTLKFTVSDFAAGQYNLVIHYVKYFNGTPDYSDPGYQNLYVNGEGPTTITYYKTMVDEDGDNWKWKDQAVIISLKQGTNTLLIENGYPGVSIDYIYITQ